MTLRRNALSDERRRRVLRDEHESGADTAVATDNDNSTIRLPQRRYNAAALQDAQPRITDFIPRRRMSLVISGLLILLAIATVEALYCGFEQWRTLTPMLSAFDVAQAGSVSSWAMTLGLVISSGLCVVILCVRRHRTDDYRGSYRVWNWLAAASLFGSVFVATNTFAALQALTQTSLGEGFMAQNGLTIFTSVVVSAIGLRLLLEIRQSRLATFSLLGVAMFGLTSLLIDYLYSPAEIGSFPLALAKSYTMLASVGSYLFCLLAYSRHVHLDAQGLLVVAEKKQRSARRKKKAPKKVEAKEETSTAAAGSKSNANTSKKATEDSDDDSSSRSNTDSNSGSGRNRLKVTAEKTAKSNEQTGQKTETVEEESDDEPATLSYEKMSKAEKRRMRKQQKQSGRRAA